MSCLRPPIPDAPCAQKKKPDGANQRASLEILLKVMTELLSETPAAREDNAPKLGNDWT